VALQGVEDENHPSIPHDRRALKFLALPQAAGQRFYQHLHFGEKFIHHQAVSHSASCHDGDRKFRRFDGGKAQHLGEVENGIDCSSNLRQGESTVRVRLFGRHLYHVAYIA